MKTDEPAVPPKTELVAGVPKVLAAPKAGADVEVAEKRPPLEPLLPKRPPPDFCGVPKRPPELVPPPPKTPPPAGAAPNTAQPAMLS